MIDRGRQSYEVFELFRHLKSEMGERCIIIRGNYEDMMMNAALWPGDSPLWKNNGGNKTIRSFYKHGTHIFHHAEWFKSNTVLTYEDENFQCCHAGLDSEDIAENLPEVLMWDRTRIDRNDYYGKLTIIGHTPIEEATWYVGDEETIEILPEHKWMPLPETGLICIDTGCVFGYKLSAMVVGDGEYWLDSVFWSKDKYSICDECGSEFLKSSSKMMALCPECAHILYGYPNCAHVFKNGRCIYCHWDGSQSEYIKWLKSND